MTFDQAQSPRLGQRTPVESTYVRIFTGPTLPEAAWRGQVIYREDTQELLIYNGIAWEEVVGGQIDQLTFVGPSVPTAGSVGDQWFDTANGYRLYISRSAGADEIKAGEWELAQDSKAAYDKATEAVDAVNVVVPVVEEIKLDIPVIKTDIEQINVEIPEIKLDIQRIDEVAVEQRTDIDLAKDAADAANLRAELAGTDAALAKSAADVADALARVAKDTADIAEVKAVEAFDKADAAEIKSIAAEISAQVAQARADTAYDVGASKTKVWVQGTPPISGGSNEIWYDSSNGYKQYRSEVAGADSIGPGEWTSVQDAQIGFTFTKLVQATSSRHYIF